MIETLIQRILLRVCRNNDCGHARSEKIEVKTWKPPVPTAVWRDCVFREHVVEDTPMLVIDDDEHGARPDFRIATDGLVNAVDEVLARVNVRIRMLIVLRVEHAIRHAGSVARLQKAVRREPVFSAILKEIVEGSKEAILKLNQILECR